MKALAIGMAGTFALAACAMDGSTTTAGDAAAASRTARAELVDASGTTLAIATAADADGGIDIRVDATAIPAGAHGVHVHLAGTCTPPGFDSAGGHWNPTGAQHGKDKPAGMHKGDLPNMDTDAGGRGSVSYRIEGANVADMLDADGASIIVHAAADDYRTDPSGNSGGRIACGVFR